MYGKYTAGDNIRCDKCMERIELKVGNNKCSCGAIDVNIDPPKFLLDNQIGAKSTFITRIRFCFSQNYYGDRQYLRGNSSTRLNYSDTSGNYLLQIQTIRDGLYQRLENAILQVCLACRTGVHPRGKKSKDFFYIRTNCGVTGHLDFDTEAKTFRFNDYYFDFAGIVTEKGWKMTEIQSLQRKYGFYSTVCRCMDDIMGYFEECYIKNPKDSYCNDVPIKSYTDINHDFDSIWYISKHQRHDFDDEQDATNMLWYRLQEEVKSYRYNKFIRDEIKYLRIIFNEKGIGGNTYDLFKQLITISPNEIEPLANAKLRERGHAELPIYKELYEKAEEAVIKSAGRDKCIICGRSIHNLAVYKDVPTPDVLYDAQNRVGAVCCSCYGNQKALRDKRLAESKTIDTD